jgi:DNA-binding response OmpR family regulator
MTMPAMTGLQLVREVRHKADMPVISVPVTGTDSDKRRRWQG